MIAAHPSFDDFFDVLKNKPGLFTAWSGKVLRQAPPRWLSTPFRFTGVGSVLARAAFENLAEGLAVPSARHHGGVNIVYYPSNRLAGTVIDVLDPSGLPPDKHGLVP